MEKAHVAAALEGSSSRAGDLAGLSVVGSGDLYAGGMATFKRYARLATCQLNQWAMSFLHNRDNIIKSIRQCRALGAAYRLGPELEIPGYGCEDHFFELDTVRHSWEMLADILRD